MKWFDKWLSKKMKEAASRVEEKYSADVNIPQMRTLGGGIRQDASLDQDRCIRFNVYIANGGRIIETFKYDDRKDRSQKGLYIIGNDQDFGHEVDKIITMEALKTP